MAFLLSCYLYLNCLSGKIAHGVLYFVMFFRDSSGVHYQSSAVCGTEECDVLGAAHMESSISVSDTCLFIKHLLHPLFLSLLLLECHLVCTLHFHVQ